MKIFICEDDPKQRENMVTIIKNYIMIEEKPMEIALATDNPYEVLEQAKNMNDIGCYFLDIQLSTDINGIKLGSEIRKHDPVWIHRNLVTTVFIGFGVPNGSLNYILSKILVVFLSSSLNFSSNK